MSLDGARVFNFALWTSAEAHARATENVPPRLAANAKWRQAHTEPGLLSTTFQRYRPLLRLIP